MARGHEVTILVDMDAMCDFDTEWRPHGTSTGFHGLCRRRSPPASATERLQPIAAAIRAVQHMRTDGYDVHICASPMANTSPPLGAAEKLSWVSKHLGEDWVERVILTSDTTLLVGDVMIDARSEVMGRRAFPEWTHISYRRTTPHKLANGKELLLQNWQGWKPVVERALRQRNLCSTHSKDESFNLPADWSLADWFRGCDLGKVVADALDLEGASAPAQYAALRELGQLDTPDPIMRILGHAHIAEAIARTVHEHTRQLADADGQLDGTDGQSKFNTPLKLGPLSCFFGGLDGLIGPPSPNLRTLQPRARPVGISDLSLMLIQLPSDACAQARR